MPDQSQKGAGTPAVEGRSAAMSLPPPPEPALERRIGLRSAVLFNLLEMIGVGPFITLSLVLAAAGPRLSIVAWILGAVIAVADGLVWAELGAALPRAGGSYAFLREIYGPRGAGDWLGFLYVWQLCFSAPLSIASGCIGLGGFLGWFWRGLERAPIPALASVHYANLAGAGACLLVTLLLYRNLGSITRLAWILFAGVLTAIAGVIVSGLHGWAQAGGWHLPPAASTGLAGAGLAQATLIATYDYWGYYNITFLGGEVRRPERTIPRAILSSVLIVAALYVAMNLAALPAVAGAARHAPGPARLELAAEMAQSAFGPWAGGLMAALIVWTAFASVFSLLLGYSRVPYAAARDGNFFRALDRLHPRYGIPHRSLLALGAVATLFCLLPLEEVITLLVITRILLQFLLQQAGVMVLRRRRPDLERPFRMPLYPLPPLVAMTGFLLILANRRQAWEGVLLAGLIAASGTLLYAWRARRLGQWPFGTG